MLQLKKFLFFSAFDCVISNISFAKRQVKDTHAGKTWGVRFSIQVIYHDFLLQAMKADVLIKLQNLHKFI